jgi:TAP-like protein
MYAPSLWPATAAMLAQLEQGVANLAIELLGIDLFGIDVSAFWSITAADGDHPRGIQPYLDAVRHTWGTSDHFWMGRGYEAARFGFWPVEGRGEFRGPFRAHGTVQPLIFAVRHDPATPSREGQRLARDLGARLLTVHGDGHGAIGNPCMAELTTRYIEDLEVPAPGVTCSEPKPFGDAAASRGAAVRRGDVRQLIRRERRAAMWGMPVAALAGR